MKKINLIPGVISCIVILTASHITVVNSQTQNCPRITGEWFLNSIYKLTITDKTGCKIKGKFKGEKTVLKFEGNWDKNEKVYKYEGTASRKGTKCELIVDGTLTLQNSKLINDSGFNYTNQCNPPDELTKTIVFTRK